MRLLKGDINLGTLEIDGNLVFINTIICGSAVLNEVRDYNALFEDAEIGEDLNFTMATIGRKEKVESDPSLIRGGRSVPAC